MKQKIYRLENVKRIGTSIGACVTYSSLEWCQQKVAEVGQIKMKKEKLYQNNYSGIGIVVYGVEK